MSNRPKQHHFVPQSLLRNFKVDGKKNQIFVFDKESFTSFPNSISNTGSEKFFYSIRLSDFEFNFERYFDEPDRILSKLVPAIIQNRSLKTLSANGRNSLLLLTAFQNLRTRTHLDGIIGISQTLSNLIRKMVSESNVSEGSFDSQLKPLSEEEAKLCFLDLSRNLDGLTSALKEKVVYLLETTDEFPFLCSDNPVIINNRLPYGEFGFESKGIEIYFPISKQFCITFKCKSVFYNELSDQEVKYFESNEKVLLDKINFGLTQLISQEYATYINSLLIRDSNRFLYSNKDSFDLAKQFLTEFPKYRTRRRDRRFHVVSQNSIDFERMPPGKHLVVFTRNHNTSVPVQEYNTGILTFQLLELGKLQRIRNDLPIEEIKLIVDRKIRLHLKDLDIEWIDQDKNSIKLRFRNPAMAEWYTNWMKENSKDAT